MISFLSRTVVLAALTVVASLPFATHAQFSDATRVSLRTNNSTIPPNSAVLVSLEAYTIDTVGASVRWYVDGTEVVSARDNRSLEVQTGPIGSKTNVRATIARSGEALINTTLTLIPSRIDIIIEADTYVPFFYEGRALPVRGGTIRAVAVPIVGSTADPATFSYDWERNGSSVLGGPSLGSQAVEMETSRYGREVISVTVYDGEGTNLGSASISHRAVEPELYFYENNPLLGLNGRAITDTFTMLGEEVTIQAEPYFIEGDARNDTNQYEWRVDGVVVNETTAMNNQISLQRANDAGRATIDLKLVSGKELPHLIRNSFSLFYQ